MKLTKSLKRTSLGRKVRRHLRIRKRVAGTAERPRLYVRKTLKHLYAQVIDDSPKTGSKTILLLSTDKKGEAATTKGFRNITNAKALGASVAAALKECGIQAVVFDRGGYKFHGCIKAICDAVREGGIKV